MNHIAEVIAEFQKKAQTEPQAKVPKEPQPTPYRARILEPFEADYHCTAEWHLSRLSSGYATPLYGFALHLSKKSGSFFCSQLRLARYFNCSPRSIWTAMHELEGIGFFIRMAASKFHTNDYTVLPHETWAKKNPGKCTTKLEMPWSAEGEELGRRLYAISGGRVKFRPEQIDWLKLNFANEQIEKGFRNALAMGGVPLDKHGFVIMRGVNWEALCR